MEKPLPNTEMQTHYMKTRGRRTEVRTLGGRFRGGKLAPVMAIPFLQSESGVVEQTFACELDQIAGRLISEITAEVVSVFVPILAVEAALNADEDHAGNTEIFREKLMSGEHVFGLEAETEVSRRLGVVPVPIAGDTRVCAVSRVAHNIAVNHLRRLVYDKAQQVAVTNQDITPAIISETVLQRFNGVLDPEDRVNGAVSLSGTIPIEGIDRLGWQNTSTNALANSNEWTVNFTGSAGNDGVQFALANDGTSQIVANFSSGTGQQLSLQDFYTAERMDELTRGMRRIVDENPEYGEDILARVAHGLSVDTGKEPFVVYRKEWRLTRSPKEAMDGENLDVMATNGHGIINFTVPIPKTEFGGLLITFASVKPDETLPNQPHPILSAPWQGRNFLADETAVDPVPVRVRELDCECDVSDEGTIAMYVGPNHIYRRYSNYGFNRQVDPTTVESKTAIWSLTIPNSVTPETVIYPPDIDHYPFSDQLAEVVQYTISAKASIVTPLIFGPTPVEELAIIDTEDLFEEGDE